MMRFRVLLLLLPLIPILSYAQPRGYCGTDRHNLDLITEKLLQNKKTSAEQPQLRSVVKYVPVTFHLVADDDGNGRAKEEQILDQICSLNAQYADQEVIFYIDEWSYKDLTILYTTPTAAASQFHMSLLRDDDAANVYVLNSADNGNTPGFTLGYYSRVNDHIVIRRDETNGFSSTLAHEFGHFFSLLHPHNGWDCESYDEEVHGNPLSSPWAPCASSTTGGAVQAERQDGSNCETAGDYLCDTPPDYNFGLGWNDCNYNAGTMDFNGDTIITMEDNVMAYFLNCPDYIFTESQKSMIQTDYFSSQRSYIRTGNVPNTEPVDEDVVYIEPIDDVTTPNHNFVLLDWEDVPNADHYLIVIDRFPNFAINPERFIVDESQFYIETLDSDKKYYWRVWPFNASQTCAGWSETQSFFTGTGTAVVEIPSVENFQVYPNPTRGSNEINMYIETHSDFRGEVNLYDIYGKIVRSYGEFNFASSSKRAIPLLIDNLPEGMYVLHLQSGSGILTEKIFVQ